MHWSCKGSEGSCGENGDPSHSGTWDDAPEAVKECARKNGFNGASASNPPPVRPRTVTPPSPDYNYPPERNSRPSSPPVWPFLLLGAGAMAAASL